MNLTPGDIIRYVSMHDLDVIPSKSRYHLTHYCCLPSPHPPMAMVMAATDPILPLLLLLLLPFSAARLDHPLAGDDPLIRQVVGDDPVDHDGHDDRVLNAENHFSSFMRTFGKSYADPEEKAYRFSVFKANLRRARRHQRLDPTAVHGVTQFSDLTHEEFRSRYLGLRPVGLPADAKKAPILPTADLPDEFDWRDHGAVTPVKNQVGDFRCVKRFLRFWIKFVDWLC